MTGRSSLLLISLLAVACKPAAKTATPTLATINIAIGQTIINAGNTEMVNASAVNSDGSSSDVSNQVTWGTSDSDVANVTCSNGVCTLNTGNEGMVVISATYNGVIGTANVTVAQPVIVSIQAGVGAPSIALGSTTVATVEATLSDMSAYDVTSLSNWSVSDNSISFACVAGVCSVTGRSLGMANLTATFSPTDAGPALTSSVAIAVTAPVLASISVTPSSATVPAGTNLQLKVTETLTDGSAQDGTALATWSTTDPQVAQMSTTVPGLVLAGAMGQAGVTAYIDIAQASTLITVASPPPTPTSVAISTIGSVHAGDVPLALQAIGEFPDGGVMNITGQSVWTSSDEGVANFSDGGLLSPLSEGSTTINVTYEGVNVDGGVPVTVEAALTTVVVTPASVTLDGGSISLLTANGVYADSSTAKVTEPLTWTTNASTVVALSPVTGSNSTQVVSCLMSGTGTVTASAAVASGSIASSACDINCE